MDRYTISYPSLRPWIDSSTEHGFTRLPGTIHYCLKIVKWSLSGVSVFSSSHSYDSHAVISPYFSLLHCLGMRSGLETTLTSIFFSWVLNDLMKCKCWQRGLVVCGTCMMGLGCQGCRGPDSCFGTGQTHSSFGAPPCTSVTNVDVVWRAIAT